MLLSFLLSHIWPFVCKLAIKKPQIIQTILQEFEELYEVLSSWTQTEENQWNLKR